MRERGSLLADGPGDGAGDVGGDGVVGGVRTQAHGLAEGAGEASARVEADHDGGSCARGYGLAGIVGDGAVAVGEDGGEHERGVAVVVDGECGGGDGVAGEYAQVDGATLEGEMSGGGRGGGVLLCGDIALRGLGGDGRRRRLGGDEYGARQCHEHGYGYGKEGFMITIGHWKSDE